MIFNAAAIVSTNHMAAVVAASELRRGGIVTETFLSGSVKKQWSKAKDYEVVVLLDDGVIVDRVCGGRKPFAALLPAVNDALDQGIPA